MTDFQSSLLAHSLKTSIFSFLRLLVLASIIMSRIKMKSSTKEDRNYRWLRIPDLVLVISGIGVASYGALGHVPPLDFQLVKF